MRTIRPSAKALIIRGGKMLAVKLKDEDGEFYIMPGGGQDVEETLSEAVVREVAEETGLRVACRELLFVIEGVHGERFHRIDLVFHCELSGEDAAEAVIERHADTLQVGCEWLEIATLNRQPLYPSKLRRQIMNFYEGIPYQTYLGNEDPGDAECLT